MTAITIPSKITGDTLTAAEFVQILDAIKTGSRSIVTEAITSLGEVTSPKCKITAGGGLAVKLTNKVGAPSVKGFLVTSSSETGNAVQLCEVGVPNCIGVFLDSDVADGDDAWVVVNGIADVYFSGDTVSGHLARVGLTTDTGEMNGQAISEAIPTSPFATDKHFCEIGHVLETRTGAGLAKCILHFN